MTISNLDFLMLLQNNVTLMRDTIRQLENNIANIGKNALNEIKKLLSLYIEPDDDGVYGIVFGYNDFYYVKAKLEDNGELIKIKSLYYKESEGIKVVTDNDKIYKIDEIMYNDIPNLLDKVIVKIWNRIRDDK